MPGVQFLVSEDCIQTVYGVKSGCKPCGAASESELSSNPLAIFLKSINFPQT